MGRLSIQISHPHPDTDPLTVLIEVQRPGHDDVEAPSKLPFDQEIALRAVLKALEATYFRVGDFSEPEQAWLRREGLIQSTSGQEHYSPKMRQQIGEKLFCCLFPTEPVRHAYESVRESSIEEGISFQIGFGAQAPLVGAYPWELLYHGRDFLVGGGRGTLTRYITFDSPPPVKDAPETLGVLLIVPRPTELAALGYAEAQVVRQSVDAAPGISLAAEPVATYSELFEHLSQHSGDEAPDIIHFDGHGTFGRRCPACLTVTPSRTATHCRNSSCGQPLTGIEPQGYLVFQDAQRQPDYRSTQELSDLVRQALVSDADQAQGGTRLVVLSACRSAVARGVESVFSGTAQRLIDACVPAVMAMQFSIKASAAAQFAKRFYERLAKREPLVQAMSWGRTALGREGDQWYRPVLYLRWRDNYGGQLFGAPASHLPLPRLRGQPGQYTLVSEIDDLAQKMDDPAVRAEIEELKTRSLSVSQELQHATGYKRLHDQLHALKFQCLHALQDNDPRFPDDASADVPIEDAEFELGRIIAELKAALEEEDLPAAEGAWVEQLIKARTALAAAIDNRDKTAFKRAFDLIRDVLRFQPTHVNTSLKNATNEENLQGLADELTRLHARLSALDLDPAWLSQLQKVRDDLHSRIAEVTRLIDTHNAWQQHDNTLGMMEPILERNFEALKYLWPTLKTDAETLLDLHTASQARLAPRYRQAFDDLDQAIAVEPQERARPLFDKYRNRAALQFFRIDTDLKEQCQGLKQGSQGLARMLEMKP